MEKSSKTTQFQPFFARQRPTHFLNRIDRRFAEEMTSPSRIRTYNASDEKPHSDATNADSVASPDCRGRNGYRDDPKTDESDSVPDLLASVWLTLSDDDRADILAKIKAAKQEQSGE